MTDSPPPLRVLLVEDNPADVVLVRHELEAAGLAAVYTRAEGEADFAAALDVGPDVILCDWSLPQFSALRALEVVRERAPDVPFLVVSGSVGEESAVQAIKLGATDYLLKDRLGRLGAAVRQALAQRDLRRAERQAREALGASESRYRALADSVPQLVWTARASGRIGYFNRRATEFTGLPLAALVGWGWRRAVHPDDVRHTVREWAGVVRDAAPRDIEFRLRRADGEYRWHINRQVAVGAAGDTVRWIGTCTDIHDQKRAAEQLARDAQILASVRDAIIVFDTGKAVAHWNDGAAQLFGWAAAEAMGRTCTDLFPDAPTPPDGPGADWYGEFETRRKDGSRVWVHARYAPLADAAGRPVGRLAVAYDLTDRKRAEESLAAVMRSVGDAVITAADDGVVESVNPATERVFGYPAAELVGQNVRALMPEPYHTGPDDYVAAFQRTGATQTSGIGREFEGRRKDGTTFPADLSVTEFWVEGRRHFTGVVRDISERKRLEEQFRQAQKMEAVGRLAGGVAHDFNNLLTVINGYSDLMLAGAAADHPHRPGLAAVRDAGERAAGLTSQLLAFSRKAIVAPRVLDLNEVVAASEKLLRRLIGEDVALTTAATATPCRVEADPTQLDQVLMNLVVNARDAMPTGGRLTIATGHVVVCPDGPSAGLRPGRYAELSVRDTGTGMTDEVKARMFEPFFTTKGVGKGTGLGLAVVHGVVQQAGGHVLVESSPLVGTTFRVLLPLVPEPAPTVTPGPAAGVHRGTETVLLVEDEDAVRQLCQVALESQGYTVLAAPNGRAALHLTAKFPGRIDLLVTDVVMPEMSGRELADAVRGATPGVRVLYVSGYTDDAVLRYGIRDAADDFLQKPFTPLGLARKVRAVLDAKA